MGLIIFRLLRKSANGTLIVPQNTTYNERYVGGANKGKVKRKRKIRYCEDLETIFVDEQDKITDKPKETHKYFKKGDLKVSEDNITLADFMRKSSYNEANGGKLFKELDIENDDLFEVAKYEIIDTAKESIRKAHETVSKAVAISLLGYNYINKSHSKIVIALRLRCDNDVDFSKKVNAYFDENDTTERRMVDLALVKKVIVIVQGKKISWNDGDTIYIGTQAEDVIKDFTVWVKTTEEGRGNLKLISEKLDKL